MDVLPGYDADRPTAWRQWFDAARQTIEAQTGAPAWWRSAEPVRLPRAPVLPEQWSLEALREYDTAMVEVQHARNANADYEINSPQHIKMMPVSRFIEFVATGAANDTYITAQNAAHNSTALAEWYRQMPDFEFLQKRGDWGRFLWVGAGTRTPLHHDLSQIIMVQLHGSKCVWFVPPGEQPKLQNERHVHSGLRWLTQEEADKRDINLTCKYIVPGDVLFIPVGWWHQVEAPGYSVTATYTNFRWPNDFTRAYP